jgi:hypothetical protein
MAQGSAAGRVRDPRLCMDKSRCLPWKVAQSMGRHEAAVALHPTTDWPALLLQAGLVAPPLPSLACIAAKALQSKLKSCLEACVSQQGTAAPRTAAEPPSASTGGGQGQAGSRFSGEVDAECLRGVHVGPPASGAVALPACAVCMLCRADVRLDARHAARLPVLPGTSRSICSLPLPLALDSSAHSVCGARRCSAWTA